MRTNEPDPQPFRPLGEKVVNPAPAPAQPEWKQVPGAATGVQVGPDGKLRTNIPGKWN